MNRLIIRQFVLFLFLLMSIAGRASAAKITVDLTKEERQWLDEHQTIRVSNISNWIPFSFTEDGKPVGFSIDYMDTLCEMLEIEIDYISGPRFSEYLVMAQHREIDVILGLAKLEERFEYLDFTTPFLRNANVIVSRTDSVYGSLEQLAGKTVAVLIGTFRQELLEKKYPDIRIRPYPSYKEAIFAVSTGEIDAVIGGQSAASYFIREFVLEDVSISGIIPMENPALEELCIGVRNDWPLLTSSIQKAMEAFPREEYEKIRNSWFDIENETSEISVRTDLEFIRIIAAIFFGIIFINAVGLWIFKKLNLDISKLKWNGIRVTSFVALAVFVTLVAFLGFLCVNRVEQNYKEDIKQSLDVVLKSADQSLSTMISFNLNMLSQHTQGHFQTLVEDLLLQEEDNEMACLNLERYLSETFPWTETSIYLVIDKNFRVAASNFEGRVGKYPEFLEQKRAGLIRAFDGWPQFLTPITVFGANGVSVPRGFFLVPIQDKNGEVLAVLAASYDPRITASRITESFRFAETAETYAFDESGMMATESRFTEELMDIGMIRSGTTSILQVEIRDPGINLFTGENPTLRAENLEFTKMALSALSGIDDWSMEEYRNYRGVPVFGVWLWNEDYRYGLATEVDADEIMTRFKLLRKIIILTFALTLLLAVGTTLMSLIVSGKANEALNLSNIDLKKRVEARTAELSAANELFRSASEAIGYPLIVIDVATYEIVLTNMPARNIGAVEGQPCYSAIHNNEKPCDNYYANACSLKEVIKTKQPVVIEKTRKDSNGEELFLEVHTNPIFNERGEVFQVIEYILDITDRKKIERQIQEHKDMLEAMIEAAADSIIIADKESKIVSVNHQTESLFGYDRSELIHQPLESLFFTGLPEKTIYESSQIGPVVLENKSNYRLETDALKKSRKSFPVEISFSSLDISGEVVTQYIIRDITKRKADEEMLKEHVDELELFSKLTVGREERMIELKKEVNELCLELNLPEKYTIVTEE